MIGDRAKNKAAYSLFMVIIHMTMAVFVRFKAVAMGGQMEAVVTPFIQGFI